MRRFDRSFLSEMAYRRRRRVAVFVLIPVLLICLGVIWSSGPRRGVAVRTGPAVAAPVAQPKTNGRPSKPIAFSDGCRTSECHASMLSAKFLHAPVAKDACGECHGPDSGGHTYPIVRSARTLCRECHNITDGEPFRHMNLNADGCTACHDPHDSAAPGLLRAETMDRACAACHPATDGSVRHHPYAAGSCRLCHQPHGEVVAGAAADERARNLACIECHPSTVASMSNSAHAQGKVDGSCLACHGAHATDRKALLHREPKELCTGCHKEVGQEVKGLVTHDAVLKGKQCITCHTPHSAGNGAMLVSDQAAVSRSCHARSVKAADGRQIPAMPLGHDADSSVHGPVASGDCAACHSVHGGNHARLLKRINPAVLSGGYDTRNYALCFTCHDSELLLSESAFDTRFANGQVNLHRLHLSTGDRSRSCSTCHAVHTSPRPRLIAETAPYEGSSWRMPIGFGLKPNGGSCAPGCHEPMSYSRDFSAPVHHSPQRGAP